MTLDQLSPGDSATILTLSGEPGLVQRLYEMGFYEGEPVELIAFAPLGDPIEVRIGATRLSLRQREASAVAVEKRVTP